MNKVFRKLVSAATTAALLVTMIPAGIVASATSSALPLYLNKTAVQKSGSTNEWNVTLTVSGSSSTTKTTSDIVIVFDASGSMANYMTKAKNGAKTIVNTVLSGNKSQTTRVAAVAFSGGIDNSCNLSNSASYVNGVIDSFYAGGGTNTQLGIYTAEQLLKSSTATNKFIVLLSDGEPTYSYKASSATKYTSTNNPLVSYSDITRSNFTLSGFDYDNLLGSGNSYNLGSDSYYAYSSADDSYVTVNNNGVGTISEAMNAKSSSTEIYSIGYNLSSDNNYGKYVLRNVASGANYYKSATTSNIEAVCAEIAGNIENKISATNSQVIDIVGGHFDLESSTVSADSGATATASKNASGNDVITWNTGNIGTATKTLTYTVKLKEDGATGELPTNESAVISYTDSNGSSATQYFPVPKVYIYNYTVNYFKDGVKFNTNSGRLSQNSVFTADVAGNLPTGYSLSSVKNASGSAVSADQSGKYTSTVTNVNGNNVLNVYYTKNNYGYTVNYLEQGTSNVLAPAKTGTAAFGTTVTENAIGITGYTAVAPNGTVTIATSGNVINLYYTKNNYGYTVNYLEQGTSNVLAPAKTGTAAFGATVTESSIAIEGFTPVAENGTVTIATSGNVINLYYTRNNYGYTVNYLEQGTTNVLAPAKTGTAAFGATVTESSIAIEGFTPVAENGTVTIATSGNVINLYYTRNNYGYTVNYLEQGTTNALAPAKTGTAAFGATVTESSIAIEGFTPVAANGTVTIATSGNVINLYYTRNNYGYTVNYLEQGTTNVLAPAKTGTAAFGATVTENAIGITGYTAVAPNGSVTIATSGNVINLYYTKNNYGYTVNYLEQGTNNILAPAKTGTAAFGATVTENAIGITGYTAVAPNGSVTIATSGNVINLYYTRNNYGYTVNYLEQGTTNALAPAKTGTAAFGATVTENAIGITGFTAVAENGTVTIATSGNVINLYYTRNNYGYTVNYLEQGTTNALAPAKTGTAAFGATVTESSIAIEGFTPVAANGTVTIATSGNVINLYYTRNNYGYTVNYLEQGTTNVLAPAKTGTAAFGATVTESSIAIEGFTPVAANGTVTIATSGNVINLYYTRNNYGYTVNYLEQGTTNVLAPAKTGTAAFGATVTESSIAIEGFTPVAANGTVTIATSGNVINLYYTRNNYGYTVNYLEQGTTNVLAPAKTGTAAFGATVTESSIAIEGFTPVAENGTVTIATSGNVINLYYTRNNYGYTVNYLEQGTTNVLAPAKTGTAAFGATVTESSIAIEGFTPVAENGTVTIATSGNVINLYYTRNNYGYTVNYLEQGTTNVLAPAKTGTAAFGATVTESSIAIEGFTPVAENGTVTIATSGNVINLYYTRNNYGYTVNYLEQGTTNALAPAKTGTAAFGATVTESSIAIEGFTPVAANGTVTIATSGNVINLYYTRNNYGYTVNYLEQGTTNALAPAKTGTAAFGATVTESSIAIEGFTPVAANGTVTIATSGNVINLYYTRNNYGYTVNYLEQGTTNVLAPAKTGTAAFGATVTESSIAIEGFTPVAENGTVTIATSGNVINLYYTRNNYGYTVNYLEQGTNNILAPAKTGTADFGTTVTEDAINITGYTAVAANDSVVIKTGSNVINLYYTANVIIDDNDTPHGDKPTDTVTIIDDATPLAASPATGDTGSALPLIAAISGLAALAAVFAKRKGKNEESEI